MCLDGRDRQPSHYNLLDGLTNAHLHASASFKLLSGKEARKRLLKILGITKILGSSLFESQIFRLNCSIWEFQILNPVPLKITVLEVIFSESSTLNEFDILLDNHGNKMFQVSLKYF